MTTIFAHWIVILIVYYIVVGISKVVTVKCEHIACHFINFVSRKKGEMVNLD